MAFRPKLLGSTEPLIKENVEESEIELPFQGFDKNTYPKVITTTLQVYSKTFCENINISFVFFRSINNRWRN